MPAPAAKHLRIQLIDNIKQIQYFAIISDSRATAAKESFRIGKLFSFAKSLIITELARLLLLFRYIIVRLSICAGTSNISRRVIRFP